MVALHVHVHVCTRGTVFLHHVICKDALVFVYVTGQCMHNDPFSPVPQDPGRAGLQADWAALLQPQEADQSAAAQVSTTPLCQRTVATFIAQVPVDAV